MILMLETVTEYIRNLCVFVIFMSLAKIIIPTKFKDYLNLVLGFVLVFLLINPFAMLRNTAGLNGLADAFFSMEQSLVKNQAAGSYDKAQTDAVLAAYRIRLEERLNGLLGQSGFELTSVYFEIIEDGERFGELLSIRAEVKEKQGGGSSGGGLRDTIKIEQPSFEPIRIVIGKNTAADVPEQTAEEQETAQTTRLKKLISDFYNLPADNIYIKEN